MSELLSHLNLPALPPPACFETRPREREWTPLPRADLVDAPQGHTRAARPAPTWSTPPAEGLPFRFRRRAGNSRRHALGAAIDQAAGLRPCLRADRPAMYGP